MAMVDENTYVQPPVGQTGNQKQPGDQQGAVPPFQFDTMIMDQQTQPIQQGITQSAQEQNSASQSSDGGPMTLDSMQQGFQNV